MGTKTQRLDTLPRYVPQRATGFAIIERARQGVNTQRVDQLSQLLGLSLKEMAALLQIAERTLHRFRSEGRLDQQASERLLLLDNLAAHGLQVFDDRADALANWLRYPLRELQNQPPFQLLTTISGFGLVDDVLTRIEYGVYS
ncbi:type II RES/Xre toxin-antitoxin system antitoxin [Fibrella arboris]|uniref:type II RES/Xre toxin-antitoxin system antitoxin n=1 Tax=Fibrella arboris TaxID=3242486 RepID=UPI003521D1C7